MPKFVIAILMILYIAIGCKNKTENISKNEPVKLSDSALDAISHKWKNDSLGCLGHRNPKEIAQLIEHLHLIGRDSTEIIRYLGRPNFRYNIKNDTDKPVFVYFLECADKKRSYYNFYCYLRKDALDSFAAVSF